MFNLDVQSLKNPIETTETTKIEENFTAKVIEHLKPKIMDIQNHVTEDIRRILKEGMQLNKLSLGKDSENPTTNSEGISKTRLFP